MSVILKDIPGIIEYVTDVLPDETSISTEPSASAISELFDELYALKSNFVPSTFTET